MHPDKPNDPTGVLVVVEGGNDIEFLRRISVMLHRIDNSVPTFDELEREGRLILLPLGGGDFRPWLLRLAAFGWAEFHLYDRETSPISFQRQRGAAVVNTRKHSRACVTTYRCLENYLHPDAIRDASGLELSYASTDDVAELAARTLCEQMHGPAVWPELSRRARRRWRNRVKSWLNTTAVDCMTPERLSQSDPDGEVIGWLRSIAELLDYPKSRSSFS